MSANGISTLSPHSARVTAKLNLAQTERQAVGTNAYRVLNTINPAEVNPPRPTPLAPGRPWV